MKQKIDPNTIVDAAVERIDPDMNTLRVCWELAGQRSPVTIYHGQSPDTIDRLMPVAVSAHGCVDILGLDAGVRHYLELVSEGSRMLVAERRLKLDGAFNFRDIGGYAAKDGRRVRWGRVFRADGLGGLSDNDMAFLRRIGLRRVIDFRTASEAANAPDRLPDDGSMAYIHLPITHGRYDFSEAVHRFKKGDTDWLTTDYMKDGYVNNLESFADAWAAVVFQLLDAEKGPIVFHCTGGKDRTGTCAALLLLALGVPAETVVDDHQLSNIYIAKLLPDLYQMMRAQGIDPEKVFPYLTAPRDCIEAVIDHITSQYGSARDYFLSKTDVTENHLEQLEDLLLADQAPG